MAIRKTIKELLKYFECNEHFAHDLWSLNIGALSNSCYSINHSVIKYRVHDFNATAQKTIKILSRSERIQQVENKLNYLKYIHSGINQADISIINRNEYSKLLKAIAFYNFKNNSMKYFSLINVFKLFTYLNIYFHYFNFKQFLIDIMEILDLRDKARITKSFLKKIIEKKNSITTNNIYE